MAEEDGTGLSPQTPEKAVTSGGVIEEEASRKAGKRVEDYFPQGVTLLTLPNSEDFIINDDTRRLLALFSNGLFLVSETHKFDGRVLSFEVLARKKKVVINKPTYVSQNELNAIYTYGERAANIAAEEADTVDLTADQMQMQKDFVQVVERAAVLKVSDIHIVVADSTQILIPYQRYDADNDGI